MQEIQLSALFGGSVAGVLLVSFGLFILAAFLAYFFLSGFIWGAGYEPTRAKDVDAAAKLLDLKEDAVVYDLGSGTGDVLIRLAKKYRVRCVGYEIDPLKVWICKLRISRSENLKKLIEIRRQNFLDANLSGAEKIYVFLSGGTKIMEKLEHKLSSELKKGARVASYIHSFQNLKAEETIGNVRVYSIVLADHGE